MPNPTEVVIIKRDGSITPYTTYGSARADAVSGDLIQIRADLNEQILLKNLVDIWIMPGVVIDFVAVSPTPQGPTITDNNTAVTCNIYGMGIIKNTDTTTSGRFECIKISNSNTKLSIECDYIEAVGSTVASRSGPCIYIQNGIKFHLICNKVYNKNNVAMWIGSLTTPIIDINLNVKLVETGIITTLDSGGSAIITHGNGFINIDEILCRNSGHCLSHRAGDMVARIKELKTICNRAGQNIACVHIPSTTQGTGTQELILYFDEIQCLKGNTGSSEVLSGSGVEATGGKSILIGRRIFSSSSYAISYGGTQTNGGLLKCDEIVSESNIAINLGTFLYEFNIIANYIEGNYTGIGNSVVILTSGSSAIYTIKNSTIKNNNTSASSKGIYFENINPIVTLNKVKIISGSENINNIYLGNGNSIDVFNYGLFLNDGIDQDKIILKIGVGTNILDPGYNYQCIIDPLLS